MNRFLAATSAVFAIMLLTALFCFAAEPFAVITPQQLKAMLDNKESVTVVIDSRSRADYDQAHIPGAKSLPLHRMTADLSQLGPHNDSKLVFYCSGST